MPQQPTIPVTVPITAPITTPSMTPVVGPNACAAIRLLPKAGS